VLNERILSKIEHLDGRAILEIGAGNGYFAPLLLERFSGQRPARLVITDQSLSQLAIARTAFRIHDAAYQHLDAQERFPFPDASFDLALAIMVLNELPTGGLLTALRECRRILGRGGQLLAAVPHPLLVRELAKRGVLTDFGRGLCAMPSAEGLRLPVSRRPLQAYIDALGDTGLAAVAEDVYPDEKTLHDKPGLKVSRNTPLALLLDCRVA